MLVNNSISAIVGLVPFVGDIILAQFKANWRNAALLEEFLRIRGETYLEMKAEGKDVVPLGTPMPKGKKKKQAEDSNRADIGGGKVAILPKGASKSDAEQIKPGAGLEKDEVVPDVKEKSSKTDAPAAAAATNNGASSTVKTTGTKRKLSFTPWRGRDSGSSISKGKQVDDRGKFVEHLRSDVTPASAHDP